MHQQTRHRHQSVTSIGNYTTGITNRLGQGDRGQMLCSNLYIFSVTESIPDVRQHMNLSMVQMAGLSTNTVEPIGKARNGSPKLQNWTYFPASLFTNHVYFTPHDKPLFLKGHHCWPLQMGSTAYA